MEALIEEFNELLATLDDKAEDPEEVIVEDTLVAPRSNNDTGARLPSTSGNDWDALGRGIEYGIEVDELPSGGKAIWYERSGKVVGLTLARVSDEDC